MRNRNSPPPAPVETAHPLARSRFHTRAEFAELLRCSLRRLDRLSHTSPEFPSKIKHGRATLYATESVERYLSELIGRN